MKEARYIPCSKQCDEIWSLPDSDKNKANGHWTPLMKSEVSATSGSEFKLACCCLMSGAALAPSTGHRAVCDLYLIIKGTFSELLGFVVTLMQFVWINQVLLAGIIHFERCFPVKLFVTSPKQDVTLTFMSYKMMFELRNFICKISANLCLYVGQPGHILSARGHTPVKPRSFSSLPPISIRRPAAARLQSQLIPNPPTKGPWRGHCKQIILHLYPYSALSQPVSCSTPTRHMTASPRCPVATQI